MRGYTQRPKTRQRTDTAQKRALLTSAVSSEQTWKNPTNTVY